VTSDNPLRLLLKKLETHSVLEEEDRRAVLDLPYTLRTLEAHAYVVREGEQPDTCSILLRGFAYRQKLTSDGGRQILALHVPGEALDFQNLFLEESDHNVQMLTRGELAVVPREELQALARSRSGVGHAILTVILVEAAIFREWIVNVGRRDSRTRLAHVLCEFAVRLQAQGLGDDYGYELPMTQEQLADVLGLTPVHVNRRSRRWRRKVLSPARGEASAFPTGSFCGPPATSTSAICIFASKRPAGWFERRGGVREPPAARVDGRGGLGCAVLCLFSSEGRGIVA
jgi:CRP-like cAMP-binding protein